MFNFDKEIDDAERRANLTLGAKAMKEMYDAFIEAGFDAWQAFSLVQGTLIASINNSQSGDQHE